MPSRFTIAIPIRNRSQLVELAVRSCLRQTRPPEDGYRMPMGAVSATVAGLRRAGGWSARLPREGDRDLWARLLASGARPAS